ncbi:putative oxidoreductase [Bacteroidia bacterium]|nr:putative oxidoreductase [Bacteroidia bacterium]
MAEKIYNWGIVGAGRISRKFVDGLKDARNARAYSIAARDLTRAQQFASEKGMPVAYGSYQELANDPNVDAVYIGTTNTEHCAHAILMLEHKKPVLCEKPFAMNRQEVDKMVAAARANNTFLMEAFWTNFLPSMNAVRKIIADGTIGEVRCIHSDFGFFREYNPNDRIFNPQVGGGSVLDIGLYPVFLAVTLLGFPQRVRAEGIKTHDNIDLTASMFLEWKNGAFARLVSSFTVNLDNEAYIYGSKGKITMHGQWHCPTRISVTVNDITTDYPVTSVGNGYNYEAEEVQNCLAQGLTQSPLLPLSHSTRFISLLDSIIEQM